MDVDVDVATRMDPLIVDVVEIIEVVGEAEAESEDAEAQEVMWRRMTMTGSSLMVP